MEGQPTEKLAFQRILFCTDFSDTADRAFRYALDLIAKYQSASLILLHVIPEPDAQFWKTYLYEVESLDSLTHQHIEEKIEKNYHSKIPAGIEYEMEIRVGRDYTQILDCAREKNVDLILIGRQGKSSFRRVHFGNVTEKIARKADCPVMIIPASFEKEI